MYKSPLLVRDRPRGSIAEAASSFSMEYVPISLCMTLQDRIAPLSCITVTADTRKGYNPTALAWQFLAVQIHCVRQVGVGRRGTASADVGPQMPTDSIEIDLPSDGRVTSYLYYAIRCRGRPFLTQNSSCDSHSLAALFENCRIVTVEKNEHALSPQGHCTCSLFIVISQPRH